MSRDTEFRVIWKREGIRRKSRRFQSLGAAAKHAKLLADGDPHYRCDEGHGRYLGPEGPEFTCVPAIEEAPRIETRAVGPWLPHGGGEGPGS